MKVASFKALVFSRSSLVALFTLFTLTLTFVPPAFAQSPSPSPASCVSNESGADFTYSKLVDDVNNCAIEQDIFDDKIFNWNQIIGTADSLNVLISGVSLNHPETNQVTQRGSALAGMTSAIALAYSVPPASGVTYLARQFQKLNPVQPAYAQGVGFTSLNAVEKLWTAFRNIAYAGFIIIFVVTGFMIMFRRKISSQAVATIQDSLPRIVIALILVTFSYAIAGLMIDLMYVAINIAAVALRPAGLQETAANTYFANNVFQLTLFSWDNLALDTSKIVADTIQKIISGAFDIGGCQFKFGLGLILDTSDCLGKGVAWLVGWAGSIIFGIALIFAMVRIFFMLLMSYISIILLTIFAPIIFLFQSLPGNNGAKDWFKNMLANIAVFPAVVLMFFLAAILAGIDKLGGPANSAFAGKELFQAPLLTTGFNADVLGSLIGVGIILMTPTAAKLVKERIGVKEGAFGAGAGAAMAGLGAGAVASRNIGKAGGTAFMERTGLGQAVGGRIAAFREEPKIRTQAAIRERLQSKYDLPTYATAKSKKGGGQQG